MLVELNISKEELFLKYKKLEPEFVVFINNFYERKKIVQDLQHRFNLEQSLERKLIFFHYIPINLFKVAIDSMTELAGFNINCLETSLCMAWKE